MTRLTLTKAQLRALGMLPDEPPRERKEPGVQAPHVEGWRPGRPEVLGRAFAGGSVHRWQKRDAHRWISRCGHEKHRDGWAPDGIGGTPACGWCFSESEKERDDGEL